MAKENSEYTIGEKVLVKVPTNQELAVGAFGIRRYLENGEWQKAKVVVPEVKPKNFRDRIERRLWGRRVGILVEGDRVAISVYQRDVKPLPMR
jgi:hypothetical protein